MDSEIKDQIEKGTRIAFMHCIVRNPDIADRLQNDCSQVIPATIQNIENDGDIIAKIKDLPEDVVLEKIIEAAEKQMPDVISALESGCKLVRQEQEE